MARGASINFEVQMRSAVEAFRRLNEIMAPYAMQMRKHERQAAKAKARSQRNQPRKRKHGKPS